MKKYAWLGIGTVLFVSFQNCAPVQKNNSVENSVSASISFDKTQIQDFSTLDLWDSACDEGCTSAQLQSSQPKFLHVNLYGRLIETFPIDPSVPHEKVCLNDSQVQDLSAILSGAEVCAPIIPDGYFDDRVCTMQIQNPYAILDKNQPYEMALGFKSDSCSIPADLCGDKGIQLQTWSRAVVTDYRAGNLQAPNNAGHCE